MAWRGAGGKPLPEPMTTKSTNDLNVDILKKNGNPFKLKKY